MRGLLVVVALLLAVPLGAAPAGAGPTGCAPPPGRAARVTEGTPGSGTLLVLLHGYGSSAARLAAASGLEASGATVVAPQGTGRPARWALAGRLPGGDDLAFVSGLVARCRPEGGRVVVAGFSNGAAFAGELACHLGDRVDAVVLVAGAGLAPACDRPPTVVVHGGADRVVPVAGGPVLGGALHAAPLAAVAAERVVVVPGWGHTWPPAATDEVLALL